MVVHSLQILLLELFTTEPVAVIVDQDLLDLELVEIPYKLMIDKVQVLMVTGMTFRLHQVLVAGMALVSIEHLIPDYK